MLQQTTELRNYVVCVCLSATDNAGKQFSKTQLTELTDNCN